MARRSSPCTQADIAKLIRAALAAGVGKEHIVGVRLDRDGATVLFGEQKPLHFASVDRVVEPDKIDDSWSDVDAA